TVAKKEFRQIFSQPGWVEHDPEEIWSSQVEVIEEALAKLPLTEGAVAAIGITNQRETTIVWERKTGRPIYNAIVWQDHRTAEYCDELKKTDLVTLVRDKTGLPIDSYFSATKIKWILDNVPNARERAELGELAFGTVDTWLIWNLTQQELHVTDVTNASRTMLFNIHTLEWDEELLTAFSIPRRMLPEVCSSSEIIGYTKIPLLASIPIGGIAGDQHAALFGQLCIKAGMVKNTYGTGCFLVMNTGSMPVKSKNNLITTIAWKINGQVTYALEGSIFIGGAVVQWLRDGLGLISQAGDIEQLAASVPDNGGVYIVPAFTGLGAPYWEPSARGSVFGITRGTSAGHFARAAVESIAFQTFDVLKSMEADVGTKIYELRVDGGAAANNLLMQFQADLLAIDVVRSSVIETTALGAAYLAGLAVGYWESVDELQTQWKQHRRFSAAMDEITSGNLYQGWLRAVKATIVWANLGKE
ncbi:MAG: glpK, partial [Solimicrobium sp.]|nr:glpK [Solimicrobium sp.]